MLARLVYRLSIRPARLFPPRALLALPILSVLLVLRVVPRLPLVPLQGLIGIPASLNRDLYYRATHQD